MEEDDLTLEQHLDLLRTERHARKSVILERAHAALRNAREDLAKGVQIDHISDHGLSLGIYFRDPDGNGLEVSYELPREKWPRQDSVFAPEVVNLGLFPGPWEE